MERFFRGCLDRWAQVTGQKWADLLVASTPFLDEDLLRKTHNIGPLGYKLVAEYDKKPPTPRGYKADAVPADATPCEDPDKLPSGVLQPVAASLLTQMLYSARFARPDLLRAIAYLARKITRWREMQDHQLFRSVCYLKGALSFRQ